MKLSAIRLFVHDLAGAKAFYTETLAFASQTMARSTVIVCLRARASNSSSKPLPPTHRPRTRRLSGGLSEFRLQSKTSTPSTVAYWHWVLSSRDRQKSSSGVARSQRSRIPQVMKSNSCSTESNFSVLRTGRPPARESVRLSRPAADHDVRRIEVGHSKWPCKGLSRNTNSTSSSVLMPTRHFCATTPKTCTRNSRDFVQWVWFDTTTARVLPPFGKNTRTETRSLT